MRIGASIILINGYCYQSYKWNYMRPLGALSCVLKYLDKYEVDEICIIRPIKGSDTLSALQNDLMTIKFATCSSPICFGGGIRNHAMLNRLKQLPIERMHLSNAFLTRNKKLIDEIQKLYGKQALVATLPLKLVGEDIFFYDSLAKEFQVLSKKTISFIEDNADEILIIDTENEGMNGGFNFNILDAIDLPANKLMLTGGIGSQELLTAKESEVVSCLVDNRMLHRENSMKTEML